jgi:hypothetical protein
MTTMTDLHPDQAPAPARPRKPGAARCYADRPDDPCPCLHKPEWTPTGGDGCDHGWTSPRAGATTPGVRGPGVHIPGAVAPDGAAAKCPTCNTHAQRNREDHTR